MRRAIVGAGILLLLAAVPLLAHPGIGIVMDRRGNVFYTDLHHVWRIAPDGSRSVAVRDVHTHELAIDEAGNLYGEDSEYLGGDRYRHRIWRRSPQGRTTDVVPWRDGFWREYGFVHDAAGAMYWVECPGRRCVIRRREASGRTSTVAPRVRFDRQINWIAAGRGGSLYVVDGEDLRRLTPDGRVETVARDLGAHPMGMWADTVRNEVHVAVHGRNAVLHVGADGRVRTAARTAPPWAPSGVLVAPDGALWILEYSTANEARVRRIARNGTVTVFGSR